MAPIVPLLFYPAKMKITFIAAGPRIKTPRFERRRLKQFAVAAMQYRHPQLTELASGPTPSEVPEGILGHKAIITFPIVSIGIFD